MLLTVSHAWSQITPVHAGIEESKEGITLAEVTFTDDLPMSTSGFGRTSSFCIDEASGSLYIADCLRSCIIHVAADGSRKDIPLPIPMSLGSIEFHDGKIYVLDNVRDLSAPAKLHVLSREGKLDASYEIPFHEDNPHPITGEKLYRKLETVYSTNKGVVVSDGNEFVLQEGRFIPYDEIAFVQRRHDQQQGFAELRYAGRSYKVTTCFELSQPFALKRLQDGSTCFSYWDVKDYGMYRRVAAVASPLGETKLHYLPLGSSFFNDPIRFDSRGQLYVASLEGRTLVISLVSRFSTSEAESLVKQIAPYWGDPSLDSIPGSEENSDSVVPLYVGGTGNSVPEGNRGVLYSKASEFKDLKWWYDPAKNAACVDGITRGSQPTWLSSITTAQFVTGVPYNWGGTQTVQGFLERIKEGYQAGNTALQQYDNYVAGVDCSGFVWSVYYDRDDDKTPGGASIDTSGLFRQLNNWSEAYLMDVGLWVGNHAVLFTGERDSSTIFTIESTGAAALGSRVCTYYRSKAQYPPWRNVAFGLKITSPNGGEMLQRGATNQITWSKLGIPDSATVNVDISTNGGSTWSPLLQNIANTGTVNWTISTTATTQARLRIRAQGTEDTSDGVFSISEPLRVTSPNGGEAWQQYSSHPIAWTTGTIGGNVKIDISVNGGVNWQTVTSSTPNGGYYDWYIVGFSPTNQARIRISSLSYPSFTDMSDSNFSLTDASR